MSLELMQYDALAVLEQDNYGHHVTRGEASVNNVHRLLTSPLCAPWVQTALITPQNDELDRLGIDVQVIINPNSVFGNQFIDLLGGGDLSLQVKSSDPQVNKFIHERTKRVRDRAIWREVNMIVLNGRNNYPAIHFDILFQILCLSGNLLNSMEIRKMISLYDPTLRDDMTNPDTVDRLARERYVLIQRMYQGPLHNNKEGTIAAVVDAFEKSDPYL